MARYTGPVCRLCRREGTKLYLKGERCYTAKCSFDRRGYAPGVHGRARQRFSEYRLQLREKQKVKRIYGLLERPFRNNFKHADRMRGVTGENLLQLLERRLDNVVYRTGWARSRREARQLVRHGHVVVNGRRTNIPSFSVRVGDVIELREKSRKLASVQEATEFQESLGLTAPWLDIDNKQRRAEVRRLPEREDITMPIDEYLIVELYSK
ncbi:MAG: 30S ribosomal protein S4 [Candidatus Dadabacteria bacterium]|nr:MAG: 30S ribosomal protein S4 [Candidatus Dadabacteria bacterium]